MTQCSASFTESLQSRARAGFYASFTGPTPPPADAADVDKAPTGAADAADTTNGAKGETTADTTDGAKGEHKD